MNLTRREFVKESLAALGFLALPGGLFAAPAGWKAKGRPNLIVGILSDTHLMVEYDGKSLYRSMTFDYVRNAFKLFKSRNIDLFMHLGDAAHRGAVREWEFHRELFEGVFGKREEGKGKRGIPEKIIIVGNHELFGNDPRIKAIWPDQELWRENAICADVARHYKRVWGEPYSEFFHKEIKGYHFFGRQWLDISKDGELSGKREAPFSEFIRSKAEECSLAGTKPFFVLSHRRHHFNFCKSLGAFPNAIAFFGHWHQSNATWQTIYCDRSTFGGFFPHIQVGACRFDGGNGLNLPDDITLPEDSSGFAGNKQPSRQAMIVNVYDDMVVFERHEVGEGGKLGPDWVLPLGWGTGKHPFTREELKNVIGEPQFGKKAKLVVEKGAKGAIKIKIPIADGNPDSRVYAYNVVVVGDDKKARYFKSVYFCGVNSGIGHEPNRGITEVEIPAAELPAGKNLTIAVRPVSSLGTKGKAIGTTMRV